MFRKLRTDFPVSWPVMWAFMLGIVGACGGPRLESLDVRSRSPHGAWNAEMLVRSSDPEVWVIRLTHRADGGPDAGKTFDVDLPTVASDEGERRVSRRKPKLFWEPAESRLIVETIGSGFVLAYLPADARPFVCDHRVLSPEDVPEGFQRTPTLDGLAREILTEPDKPHGPAEQRYVLDRIERAGVASPAGKPLVAAILQASNAVDAERVRRLTLRRLASDSSLPAIEREAELAALRAPLEQFVAAPGTANAERLRRAARVLGPLEDRASVPLVLAGLETAAAHGTTALQSAAVVDAVGPLAWLAGRWKIIEAGEPLAAFLAQRFEVPWKTRSARCVAVWGAVELGRPDAFAPLLPLLAELPTWSVGGSGLAVPATREARASAAWAESTPLGVVLAWAAVHEAQAAAAAPLRSVLADAALAPAHAEAAARALLALDPVAGRAAIARAPALDERVRRQLLDAR